MISRQEKRRFPKAQRDFPPRKDGILYPLPHPRRVVLGLPSPSCRVCVDGRTDGRSRDYYVTTKISRIHRLPNLLSNGAPLAGFARRLRYDLKDKKQSKDPLALTVLHCALFILIRPDMGRHLSRGKITASHLLEEMNTKFEMSVVSNFLVSTSSLVRYQKPVKYFCGLCFGPLNPPSCSSR